MLFKNVASQKCVVFAFDKTTGAGKTGDAANITANVSKDGAAPSASNDTNPAEIGGGLYAFDLTQGETNCNLFALYAASATSDILVNPVIGYTTAGAIPAAGVASQASVDTVDDLLDTELAAVKAVVDAVKLKTDNLPSDPADASDIAASFTALTAKVDAIDDFLDTEMAAVLAAVDTEVAAIKAKTDNLPAAPAATGDIPGVAAIAAGVLDLADAIESGWTPRQALRIMLAALAGELSGADSTTVTIRDVSDSKDRITATVDSNGNRTAVTYDKT